MTRPINYIDPTGHNGVPVWLRKIVKGIFAAKDAKEDADDALEKVNEINQYTQYDFDNVENAYRQGQSPESVYLLPVPIIDTLKKDRPDLTDEARAQIYAEQYRDSLALARPGENTLLYGQSWTALAHIDLAAELIKDGAANASNAVSTLYFMAIAQAGKGKHKTDFIIVWGYMGAE